MPIQPGDIMIKYSDGSAVNKIIRIGQAFGKGQSKYTHAGIASSDVDIIEMSGSGLSNNRLKSKYKYKVFRCNYPEVARGAREAAVMMLKSLGHDEGSVKINYDAGGAFKSISKNTVMRDGDLANTIVDGLTRTGNTMRFFCSGHVVLCYQMALSQMSSQANFPIQDFNKFDLESTCYQPAYLAKILKRSTAFSFVGKYKGSVMIDLNEGREDDTAPLLANAF